MKRSDGFKLVLLTALGAAAAAYVLSKPMPTRSSGKEGKPSHQRTRDAVRIGIPLSRVYRQDEDILCGDMHVRVTGTELVKETGETDPTFRIMLRLMNMGVRPYTYRKQHFQRQDADYDMFDEIGDGGTGDPVMLRTGEALDEVLAFRIGKGTDGFTLIYMNEHSKPVGIEFVL
ncbi:hypothetical protein [Youngiibacter fragilis]|uniref:DUF4352 domain-containing protein n=1 Tax=Youngiibacter fragilis 232.1 TaxID=994573 RepID=V7I424_9CLOT|nr:hypothetical protein [Youngiibacter fragilis]ETA80056.1 hypothetical protein T472_0213815 [Youngiibacter fragilis 232.1]